MSYYWPLAGEFPVSVVVVVDLGCLGSATSAPAVAEILSADSAVNKQCYRDLCVPEHCWVFSLIVYVIE